MQVGIIGLGRMGMNIARRLLLGGHEVVAYNRTYKKTLELVKEGGRAASSLKELVKKLSAPRIVWLMLPEGETVDAQIDRLADLLSKGDIIIDGGNSFYKDDIRRAKKLGEKGIRYIDAGVSGGVWGLKNGYCTMVGGEKKVFQYIKPILETLAPSEGYIYCGGHGAGHFAKMIHNGIEYALMEAYGEGFEILKKSPYSKTLNLKNIAHVWNRGSIIKSWLLELLESVFEKDTELKSVAGYVEDTGEGRWTVIQAVESGVDAGSIAQALFKRFASREKGVFSNRILAALRKEFGGHETKEK